MHHLTHDIGWPTLAICAFVLGLCIPGLVTWVLWEVRLYRRVVRRSRVVELRRDPFVASVDMALDRLSVSNRPEKT